MKRICAATKCTGCSACANICPTNSIRMDYNENGFLHPYIMDSCIECHLCERICPVNKKVESRKFSEAYLARSRDEAVLLGGSSSGGMFTELACQVMSRGGCVFGAEFSADFMTVHHKAVVQATDLIPLRGSKYIQSEIQDTFRQAKKFLKQNRPVLFCGAPCQIAGLQAYLKQDYEQLITADFICHGVASTKIYQDFLASLDLKDGIQSIDFRNKKNGYGMKCLLQIQTRQKVFSQPWYEISLGFAFANNLISRESCGTCIYASDKRVSDITLADYSSAELDAYSQKFGSSLVLLNTQKGEQLFQCISGRIEKRKLDRADVLSHQQHLRHPASPHQNKKKVFKRINSLSYNAVSEKFFVPFKPAFSFRRKIHSLINRLKSDRSENHV